MGKIGFAILTIAFLLPFVTSKNITEEFMQKNGYDWDIQVSEWGFIIFAARINPELIFEPITETEAIRIAEDFLEENADFFGLKEVVFKNISFSQDAELRGEVSNFQWDVNFEGQYYEEIPIEDTYTKVIVSVDGQVWGVGNKRYNLEKIFEDMEKSKISSEKSLLIMGYSDPQNISLKINDDGSFEWKFFFGKPNNVLAMVDKDGSISFEKISREERDIYQERKTYYIFLLVIPLFLFLLIMRRKIHEH